MLIHKDQRNVRALCEMADFIDSGFQSFRDQVKVPGKKLPEAAFFAGASLTLKLLEHFRSSDYTSDDVAFLTGLLVHEVNEYMAHNDVTLQWEPHVPTEWKQ